MSARDRPPLLARLRVGTKLMLLALLPVAVLAVSVVAAMDAWRAADNLRDFQAATRESFARQLARALSDERAAAVLARVRPGSAADAAVGAAQRRTDDALQRAVDQAASASSRVDAAGRSAAIRRQLQAPRLQAAAGATGDAAIADGYGLIVRDALEPRARPRHRVPPPDRLRRGPADAYVAILAALEPADRERLDVAALLSRRRDRAAGRASRWAPLEAARLERLPHACRQPADHRPRRIAVHPGGDARHRRALHPARLPVGIVPRTTLAEWLAASRSRIADMRRIAGEPAASWSARSRATSTRARAPESRARRLSGPAGSGRCAGAGPAAVDHATARRGVRERTGAVRRRSVG